MSNAVWRKENPEKLAGYWKKWCESHRDHYNRSKREWRKKNHELQKEKRREHYKANREAFVAKQRAYYKKNRDELLPQVRAAIHKYKATIIKAMPAWADEFFIKEIYRLCALRTKMKTGGVKWHVDHIVPLRSKLVCGLHVEHNLRVVPAAVNQYKNNRHWPDMP